MINGSDETDDDMKHPTEQRQSLSLIKSYKREIQQREDTISSSRSSEIGDSQGVPSSAFLISSRDFSWYTLDNPLAVEDDGVRTWQTSASTRSTSVESEIDTAHPQGFYPREQPKKRNYSNTHTNTECIISPVDRPTVIPPHPHQSQSNQNSAQDEWEIERIDAKRQTETGCEYNVRWRNTWLSESELQNAQELLQEFEDKAWV